MAGTVTTILIKDKILVPKKKREILSIWKHGLLPRRVKVRWLLLSQPLKWVKFQSGANKSIYRKVLQCNIETSCHKWVVNTDTSVSGRLHNIGWVKSQVVIIKTKSPSKNIGPWNSVNGLWKLYLCPV